MGPGSDLAPGRGGSVWFAGSRGRIGRATRSGRVTLFAAQVSRVGGLAPAPGGGVWSTAPEGVGLLSAISRLDACWARLRGPSSVAPGAPIGLLEDRCRWPVP